MNVLNCYILLYIAFIIVYYEFLLGYVLFEEKLEENGREKIWRKNRRKIKNRFRLCLVPRKFEGKCKGKKIEGKKK